jgi:hypothetical protein
MFELGRLVRWKNSSPLRLGYALSDVGKVVGVHACAAQGCEIDVAFGDGEVLHGAAGEWFEPAEEREAGANASPAQSGLH